MGTRFLAHHPAVLNHPDIGGEKLGNILRGGRTPKGKAIWHGSGMLKCCLPPDRQPKEVTQPPGILVGLHAPRNRAERGEFWLKGWNRAAVREDLHGSKSDGPGYGVAAPRNGLNHERGSPRAHRSKNLGLNRR